MKAHDGRSRAESPGPDASADFSTGSDSPVRTASSHSSGSCLEQAHVGRHDVADAERHDVAGHEAGRRQPRSARRRASTRAVWRMSACSAATALAARYSLTKPSPTLRRTIDGDDHRVDRIAGEARDGGGREQEDQQRVAQLAHQDPARRHPLHPQGVRPERAQPLRGLGAGQAAVTAPEAGDDGIGLQRAGGPDIEDGGRATPVRRQRAANASPEPRDDETGDASCGASAVGVRRRTGTGTSSIESGRSKLWTTAAFIALHLARGGGPER